MPEEGIARVKCDYGVNGFASTPRYLECWMFLAKIDENQADISTVESSPRSLLDPQNLQNVAKETN